MRYFIVSDVHGFYDEFMEALNSAGFDVDNDSHIFVSLGDLFDRGNQPNECLQFVMSLPEHRRILIEGNHETLMEEAIARHSFTTYDYSNGTATSIRDLSGVWAGSEIDACIELKHNELYNNYIRSLVPYYETDTAVFVHGWIPCFQKMDFGYGDPCGYYNIDWRDASYEMWKRAMWINGMKAWDNGIRVEGKTVFCGHWHASWGHANLHHEGVEFPKQKGDKAHFSPFVDEGIVALDACTAFTYKVNCYVLDE